MKVADAHIDTLTKSPENPFNSMDSHWDISRFKAIGGTLQYFAIFTPPEFSGDSALRFAFQSIGNFFRYKPADVIHLEKPVDFEEDKVNILLSIEGASPIINRMENLHAFYKIGVRAMGLVWNHRNFVADGIDESFGLTSFGKEVVKEMVKLGMIIDVSHLNDNGFDDIVALTQRPFIASHSNSRVIRDVKRNLTDDQIKEIIHRGGFIGMNFYSIFLGNEDQDLKKMLLKHIEHILKLGGENVLGMGSDFDGITESPFESVSDYSQIIEMLKNDLALDNNLIEKIMYSNLKEVTLKLIN